MNRMKYGGRPITIAQSTTVIFNHHFGIYSMIIEFNLIFIMVLYALRIQLLGNKTIVNILPHLQQRCMLLRPQSTQIVMETVCFVILDDAGHFDRRLLFHLVDLWLLLFWLAFWIRINFFTFCSFFCAFYNYIGPAKFNDPHNRWLQIKQSKWRNKNRLLIQLQIAHWLLFSNTILRIDLFMLLLCFPSHFIRRRR